MQPQDCGSYGGSIGEVGHTTNWLKILHWQLGNESGKDTITMLLDGLADVVSWQWIMDSQLYVDKKAQSLLRDAGLGRAAIASCVHVTRAETHNANIHFGALCTHA